ncbi:hypothetical protein L9F63_022233, partial [Diploptera punctata]
KHNHLNSNNHQNICKRYVQNGYIKKSCSIVGAGYNLINSKLAFVFLLVSKGI